MIKLNDREVTTYFKDKNYIQNLDWVIDALHQILCEEMGIECTQYTHIHFCEALMMYMIINSPKKTKGLSHKRAKELIQIYNSDRNRVDGCKVYIVEDREISSFKVHKYMKSNFRIFNEILTDTYTNFKLSYDESKCPYCQYHDSLLFAIVSLIENISSFDIPFSIILMEELMEFCMKNSRIVNLSKSDKEDFFDEHKCSA